MVDVSCKKVGSEWIVAMDKWQTLTDMKVNKESLDMLAEYCSEFLVHAADVEGLCKGIDKELVIGRSHALSSSRLQFYKLLFRG